MAVERGTGGFEAVPQICGSGPELHEIHQACPRNAEIEGSDDKEDPDGVAFEPAHAASVTAQVVTAQVATAQVVTSEAVTEGAAGAGGRRSLPVIGAAVCSEVGGSTAGDRAVVAAAGVPAARCHQDPKALPAVWAEPRGVERALAARACRKVVSAARTAGRRSRLGSRGAGSFALGGIHRSPDRVERSNRHAEILQHGEIFAGLAAQGGEVIPHDESVDAGSETHGLQVA